MSHIPTIRTYFDNREGQMLSRESTSFFNCDYDEEYRENSYVLFSDLRTQIQDIKRIESKTTFLCGCCKTPLKICAGLLDGVQQFHFKHVFTPQEGECDYYEGKKYSESDIKAMLFNGRTEGIEHKRIKTIIQRALLNELSDDKVLVEKVAKKVGPTWRKPDIRAIYEDKTVVFEVQLSPLFHHVILERNSAYRNNGWFICWLFDDVLTDHPLMRNLDAWANNNYNLFAFDKAAEIATIESGKLHLTVIYSRFTVEETDNNTIPSLKAQWVTETVAFSELIFDVISRMVYRYDSGKEKNECELLIQARKKELEQKRKEENRKNQELSRLKELIWDIPTEQFEADDYHLFIDYAEDLSDSDVESLSSDVFHNINSFDFTTLNKWLSIFCILKKQGFKYIDRTLQYLWGEIIVRANQNNRKISYVSLIDYFRCHKEGDYYRVLNLLNIPIDEEFSERIDKLSPSHPKFFYFAPLILLNRYYKKHRRIFPRILNFFSENPIAIRCLISAQTGRPFGTDYVNLKQVANEVWNSCKCSSHLFLYLIERNNLTSEIDIVKVRPGKKSINHYQRMKDYIQSFPNELSSDLTIEDIEVMFPPIK